MQTEEELKKESGETPTDPPAEEVTSRDQAFIDLAMKRYAEGVEYYGPQIEEMKKKRKFINEDNKHWPEDMRKLREGEGQICIEHNFGRVFRNNFVGKAMQTMPQGRITGFDGGKPDKKLGSIGTSILRRIEANSRVQDLNRDTIKSVATAGYPDYHEVYHAYPDALATDQEIYVRRFRTQESVILDPHGNADVPDRGGRKWGFVIEDLPRAEYERKFPKGQRIGFKDALATEKAWWGDKTIRIAGYYDVEPRQATVLILALNGVKLTKAVEKGSKEHKNIAADAKRAGVKIQVLKERKNVTIYTISHYIINSREILQGPEPVLFDRIPIAVYEGKYDYDESGRKMYHGVFDEGFDANLLLDLWSSEAAQMVITGQQVMATPKMIPPNSPAAEGWRKRVGEKVLWYEYDASVPGGRPTEIQNNANTAQILQMVNIWSDLVKDLTSFHEATLGQQGPQESGRAIMAKAQQDSNPHYEILANIEAAVDHQTRIIRSGIPKVYDYEMMLRIIGDDWKPKEPVVINQPKPTSDGDGNVIEEWVNDVRKADFDTEVTTGPSFKTRSLEATAYLSDLSNRNPELGLIIGDLALRSMDFAYAEEAENRIKALINIKYEGLLDSATGDEQAQIQQKIKTAVEQTIQQLQAQTMPAMQAAEQKIQELMTEVEKLNAVLKNRQADLDMKKYEIDRRTAVETLKAQGEIEEAKISAGAAATGQSTDELRAELDALKKQMAEFAQTTAQAIAKVRVGNA